MRRDSKKFFEHIQFLGYVTVLYIQIILIVIVNKIQTVVGALLVRLAYMVTPECCCLNYNTLLYTYINLFIMNV